MPGPPILRGRAPAFQVRSRAHPGSTPYFFAVFFVLRFVVFFANALVFVRLFRGEILAYEKVVLLSSCVVLGTVAAPRLIAEEGVLFSGRFRITGSGEKPLRGDGESARDKALLLESVRRREQSDAARTAVRAAAATRSRSPVPRSTR